MTNGTRSGWGVSVTPLSLFTPGKEPVPIVQEAGWDPEPVWISAENLASTGIWSPDRPAHSQSLYRLSYPAQIDVEDFLQIGQTSGQIDVEDFLQIGQTSGSSDLQPYWLAYMKDKWPFETN